MQQISIIVTDLKMRYVITDGWREELDDKDGSASNYRLFRKNCVFSEEFSVFCDLYFVSTGLLLVVQKMANQYE